MIPATLALWLIFCIAITLAGVVGIITVCCCCSNCGRGKNATGTLTVYPQGDNPMTFSIKSGELGFAVARFTDGSGRQQATGPGVKPQWSADPRDLLSLEPSADGYSCVLRGNRGGQVQLHVRLGTTTASESGTVEAPATGSGGGEPKGFISVMTARVDNTLPGAPVHPDHGLPNAPGIDNSLPGQPVRPDNALPGSQPGIDNSLPGGPVYPGHGLPNPPGVDNSLPGQPARPDNTLPETPAPKMEPGYTPR
jgi:hypothetical protein